MNEVKAFDPQDLRNKVSERIKATMMDLIPEETWNKMVDAEIENFLKNDLRKLIQEILTKTYRNNIEQYILSLESSDWIDGKQTPNEMVKTLVKEIAPDLITSVFGSLVQQTLYNMRNSLPRY